MKGDRGGAVVYYLTISFLSVFYKILFGLRAEGTDNIPRRGDSRGVILASNHASYLDPPVLGITLPRRATFLAKDYLFRIFLVGWILKHSGCCPVRSEGEDFRTLRDLLRILKERGCVCLFPEGTRSPDGQLQKPLAGIGFLALKSGASVVPVYIDGSFEAFPRHANKIRRVPVRVYYGKPFVPCLEPALTGAPRPYEAVSQRIMKEIEKIRDQVRQRRLLGPESGSSGFDRAPGRAS